MFAKRKNTRDHVPTPRKKMESNSKLQHSKEKEEALKAKNLEALAEKPDMEKCLENLVFGGGEDEFMEKLLSASKISADILEEDSDSDGEKVSAVPTKKPAWIDDDDEDHESINMTHRYRKDVMKSKAEKKLSKEKLQVRLKQEFQNAMGGVPSWASRDHKKRVSKEDDDDDDEDDNEDNEHNLLSRTGNILANGTSLPMGVIQIKNCLNANSERQSAAPLRTVQFHPKAQVVMTAGHDRSISLFQVDGKLNPKIQSIYLDRFPIHKAQFSADGEQVIATGAWHKIFYVYDTISGNITPVTQIRGLEEKSIKKFDVSADGSCLLLNGSYGHIHLLSMKTKSLIGSMKMNGRTEHAVFSPDSSKIYAITDSGEIYIWDVKSRKCLNRFVDDGCVRGTTLAISRDSKYVSCGSDSGVVNVYNHEDCLRSPFPKPIKSIMNLVTRTTSQVFNRSTEILAVASNTTDDAVKLVHIPSFTVFSNFPVQGRMKNIHLTQAMDFSPNSGFFSIANNKGKALLYRLKHYSDY